MNSGQVKKPLIRQGWLRVLLFFIVYFLLVSTGVSLLPRLSRWLTGEQHSLDEIANGKSFWMIVFAMLLVSVLLVCIFRLFIDRKSLGSLGFSNGHYTDGLAGLFLSLSILGTGTLILYFTGHLKWVDIIFNGNELFIELGWMLLIALYEELVFRGYILGNLMESFNKWVALLVSALLFTLFHINNPSLDFVPLANIFLAGLLLGVNYIYTKNIWFPLMFHFGWNFFQGPVLGYKVSGFNFSSVLQTELNGDPLLTGGDFGFEGSVINLALSLITFLILYAVYEKKFRPLQPESSAGKNAR